MNQFRFRPVGSGGEMKSAVMNLIIINVIFFIATFFAQSKQIDLGALLGLYHPLSPYFHLYQIFTCMFMHANFMHLMFNMLGLYFFGRMLESVWGVKKFLIFYFVCGIGASITFLCWETFTAVQSLCGGSAGWNQLTEYMSNWQMVGQNFHATYSLIYNPMVGASGAIFGIIMGAAMLFPNSTIYLYMAIPVKIKWFALIYGVIELYKGTHTIQGDNTAHFAHLGGMLFGFIVIQIYKRDRNSFY